ncbi:MAG: hypothetical protein H6668_20670 [Ardenticatenaceae bacterium]|nr:hypothetical protein [Ardenticatenaceae bacterium]
MDGWRPDAGQVDKYGNEIADKLYTQDDMERTLIIEERTKLVASRITEFLREQDRMAKTIVFCVDIDHAERMRSALVNENGDKVTEDGRYVMRITGDSEEGKGQLDNFIAPDEPYPVIATTSKLMTTGVDAKTCKLIVLDRRINSMTEFKQIIGRGTRIDEEYGKTHFTIMDFRDATRLFSDPEFDGDPVQVVEFGQRDEIGAYVRQQQEWDDKRDKLQREPRPKYVVADVPVAIRHEQQQFLTADGRLMTEKFVAFSRSSVRQVYQSLDEFLQQWSAADRKTVILAELLEHGVWLDKLEETFGSEFDPFDLICHVAFDTPTLTRKQRAERVQLQQAFAEYGEAAQKVLAGLLAKYADGGIGELDRARDPKTMVDFLQMLPFREVGRPIQIMREFGGQPQFMAAVQQLSQQIYAVAV